MAQVATNTTRKIDELLELACAALEDVADVASSWDGLSRDARVDFAVEWPLTQDRLAQLAAFSRRDELSAVQAKKYAALREQADRMRPAIVEMLAGRSPG
jgi:hypothetical protein